MAIQLSSIKTNPGNPRIIKDEKFRKLVNSIKEFPKMMELRPIVTDDTGIILGGNMRLAALKELKYKEIPDNWVKKASELTEEEKKRFIIADNVGFGEWDWDILASDYRHKIIDVIEQTPQHEYQVLTKRPEIMLKFSKERKLPPNFWAGTTIEDNRVKDRLNILKQVEAEIRFISAEPLIAPLTFDSGDLDGISWVITGGESGTHLWDEKTCNTRALVFYDRKEKKWKVREDRADWIRHIRDASQQAGSKFFHKQWGGSYPEAAGRELDGRFWTEIPRLPGQRKEIDNEYLRLIESGGLEKSKKDKLILKTV